VTACNRRSRVYTPACIVDGITAARGPRVQPPLRAASLSRGPRRDDVNPVVADGPPSYPSPATPEALHEWRVAWGHYNGARVAEAYRTLTEAA